ncbi:hypothetical protein Pmani_034788 [Petrolisthes manimaculis]|uniref:Uncharacterized protein n=1 Tax=Petrolisthes manimaculis TaxID=1843537 RepID=A0AAE1NMW1_9EUCA|nr:hypothetical protein Pmani_034788 [Petrolisthes manimaculis]
MTFLTLIPDPTVVPTSTSSHPSILLYQHSSSTFLTLFASSYSSNTSTPLSHVPVSPFPILFPPLLTLQHPSVPMPSSVLPTIFYHPVASTSLTSATHPPSVASSTFSSPPLSPPPPTPCRLPLPPILLLPHLRPPLPTRPPSQPATLFRITGGGVRNVWRGRNLTPD